MQTITKTSTLFPGTTFDIGLGQLTVCVYGDKSLRRIEDLPQHFEVLVNANTGERMLTGFYVTIDRDKALNYDPNVVARNVAAQVIEEFAKQDRPIDVVATQATKYFSHNRDGQDLDPAMREQALRHFTSVLAGYLSEAFMQNGAGATIGYAFIDCDNELKFKDGKLVSMSLTYMKYCRLSYAVRHELLSQEELDKHNRRNNRYNVTPATPSPSPYERTINDYGVSLDVTVYTHLGSLLGMVMDEGVLDDILKTEFDKGVSRVMKSLETMSRPF